MFSEINSIHQQDIPGNISLKMIKQLESIRDLAKCRIRISHNANISQKRTICIKSANVLSIQPHETAIIPIKSHVALNQANFIFTPSVIKPELLKNIHLQEAMINKNTAWIPIHNTSHESLIIPQNTTLGHAKELNEYDIAQPDNLDINIDSIYIVCEDNEPLDDPWESIHKDPDIISFFSEQTASVSVVNEQEQSIADFDQDVKVYTPKQQQFLKKFKQVFIKSHPFEHQGADMPGVKLPTKHKQLVATSNLAKRRYTTKDLEVLDKFIENSLNSKLICRIQSPTTSALHVVYKNGKPRVVSDLREVNHLNAGDFAYVFPRPTECINQLTGKGYKVYSQCDLSGAFTQIPLHRDSYPLLAFTAMTKKYTETFAYRFLNFGYKCAPAIFASVLSTMLHNINTPDVDGSIMNYFDDICAASKNEVEHYKLLSRLFSRFIKYNLKLNLKKSKFFKEEVIFCSYLISSNGYRFSNDRLTLLKDYPAYDVTNKKKNADLRVLGFLNYHRNFCKNYSAHDRRMRDAIKSFKLNKLSADDANAIINNEIDQIKTKVTETSLESISDGETVFLETDACGHSYGFILYTKRGVIQYGGGTFTAVAISSHSIFEKELRAVAIALQEVFHLLTNAGSIIIKCDNIAAVFSATASRTKRPITSRALKYILMIQTYTSCLNSSICHINTTNNLVADCLSRLKYDKNGRFDFSSTDKAIISYVKQTASRNYDHQNYESISSFLFAIEKETHKQRTPLTEVSEFSSVLDYFSTFTATMSFETPETIYDEIGATHARSIIIPENIEWLNEKQEYEYVKGLHDATHWSPQKAKSSLKLLGHSISSKVIDRIWSECLTCGAERRLAPSSKLNPHAIDSSTPLHRVHIDHVTMTNWSNNQKYIITMVCDITRFIFTQASANKETGPVIRFLERVQSYSNFKIKVLSLDNAFDGHEMTAWATEYNVELEYRPSDKSRGVLVERYHKSLRAKMNTFAPILSQWSFQLQKATRSLNNEMSDSHGFQPSYLFSGHKTDPEQGPIVDSETTYSFNLRLAKALINFEKQQRASNYKFRILEPNQKIIIQYDHTKSGKKLNGTVLSDLGENHSTVTAKIDKRHLPIKIHKTDILIPKDDPNYSKIFKDLPNSILPNITRQLE